jgi:hypothetical protein
MVYNTQDYWVFWTFPSSGIVETRKHDVSETGSGGGGGIRHLLSWAPYRKRLRETAVRRCPMAVLDLRVVLLGRTICYTVTTTKLSAVGFQYTERKTET